jgi:hypothetical protein
MRQEATTNGVDCHLERSKVPFGCPVEPLMSDRTVISVANGPRRVARHLWYLLPAAAATAAGAYHIFSLHRHARQPAAVFAAAANQPATLAAHSPYDSPEARARLWEQLRQLQAASAMNDIRKLLAIVAKTDPGLALEMVQSLTSDDLGRNLLAAGIVQVWAAHDPEGAWRWALGPGKEMDVTCQPPLSETVLAGMASTHPQMLIQFVESILGSSGDTSDPTSAAIHALVTAGNLAGAQQALAAWSRGPNRNDISGSAFAEAAAALASTSPTVAAAWLQSLPPSDGLASGYGAVANAWAQIDPQGAMAWAEELNFQENREGAISTIFDAWVTKSPAAAAQWFGTHDTDPAADQMLYTWVMGSSLRISAPETAIQWAQLIGNENLRSDAVGQTALIWAQKNPVAAASFIAQSPLLNPEQKLHLMQQMPSTAAATN